MTLFLKPQRIIHNFHHSNFSDSQYREEYPQRLEFSVRQKESSTTNIQKESNIYKYKPEQFKNLFLPH